MHRVKSLVLDLILLFIITAPAFFSILNNQFFSIHDDQHIARLFLLDQGLRQGYLYPRWVDGLGFGFGYPLYNFYPPLIYYLGEFFHLLGFSLIWSVKLVFISGFYLGSIGIYLLMKKLTSRLAALVGASLYTYFFYHAVLIYVRGALAEFFSLALLPFVFLALDNLREKPDLRRAVFFGFSLSLLIIAHPLIALPSFIFIGLTFIFYFLKLKERLSYFKYFLFGIVIGLGLSAFFWLPSMVERKYTLTDQILTGELASYKLHYIYPPQFIYSPWGYGGSAEGLADGVTFQLGKIHLGLTLLSLVLCIFYLIKERKVDSVTYNFFLTILLLIVSLFMTTEYSSFIWDRVKYLWYLQFPWRFLTFTAVFIVLIGAQSLYFLEKLLPEDRQGKNTIYRYIVFFVGCFIIVFTIFTYQKYFRPQRFINTNDRERTSFTEIAWRISSTSYEFVPKGVATKKTDLNTTTLAIEKKDLPKKTYELLSGDGVVQVLKNNFSDKQFLVNSSTPLVFRLNVFNFPGWSAYLNDKLLAINDRNDLKLITVKIPAGYQNVKFLFKDTLIRKIAKILSVVTFIFCLLILKKFKKVDG